METNLISDKVLIRQYVDGNEASFENLLKRYKSRVFSYIMFTVRDNALANDIFQETFMKVIRTLKRGKYNDEGKFFEGSIHQLFPIPQSEIDLSGGRITQNPGY